MSCSEQNVGHHNGAVSVTSGMLCCTGTLWYSLIQVYQVLQMHLAIFELFHVNFSTQHERNRGPETHLFEGAVPIVRLRPEVKDQRQ